MPIIGTPESPFDHQEAILAYQCPGCGRRGLRTTAVRIPLAQLSIEALGRGLAAAAAQMALSCDCGRPKSGGVLQAAALTYQFLHGTDRLRLEATIEEGSIREIRHAKVRADGATEELGSQLDEEGMLLAFGRPLSVRSAWDFFLRRTLDRREGQIMTFPGFAMATAPPGPRMAAALQSNAELARMAVGEDALVAPLRDVDAMAARPEGTYHDWLSPAMAHAVTNGEVSGAVIVRPGAVIDRFGVALKALGLEWKHAGLSRLRVDGHGVFFIVGNIDWLLWDITIRGYSIDETAAIKAGVVDAELRGMEAHCRKLVAAFPGWSVVVDEEVEATKARDSCYARVRHPDGNAFWVNLGTMWRKAQDGAAFAAHVEQIRGVLERTPEQLDRCACGRPAYLTKKWKPREWLTRAEAGGRPLLSLPALGHVAIFARDCTFHSMYLADTRANGGPSVSELEQRVRQDLPRHNFAMECTLLRRDETVEAVAFWGSNIASVALDPALLAGVLESVGLRWTGRVTFRAATTNALAVAPSDASRALQAAVEVAARAAAQSMGDPGEPLEGEGEVELGLPAGRFERLRPAA